MSGHVQPSLRGKPRARVISAVGCLAAISVVLMNLRVPMPSAPYLLYDPADVASLVAAFTMGPQAGIAVVGIRNLLYLVIKPDVLGLAMNFVASATFAAAAGHLYRRLHTRLGAVIALVMATLAQTAVMTAANLAVLPVAFGLHSTALVHTLLTAIIPFNLLKGTLTSVLTFLLYKRVSGYIPRL
jgi:riboflavin transporter FmnP